MFADNELLKMYHLKNVIRYSTRTRLKDESVAEHSFYVALIALQICSKLNVDDSVRNDCLIKAILHDMPESELNDITHDVKIKLNLYPFLEKYENEYFEKNFAKYADLMKDNSDNLVNIIVKYADILSVKQYVLNEQALGNNTSELKQIMEDTKDRILECHKKLKSLVPNYECGTIVTDLGGLC